MGVVVDIGVVIEEGEEEEVTDTSHIGPVDGTFSKPQLVRGETYCLSSSRGRGRGYWIINILLTYFHVFFSKAILCIFIVRWFCKHNLCGDENIRTMRAAMVKLKWKENSRQCFSPTSVKQIHEPPYNDMTRFHQRCRIPIPDMIQKTLVFLLGRGLSVKKWRCKYNLTDAIPRRYL